MTDGSRLSDQAQKVAYMYDSWSRAYDNDVQNHFKYKTPRKVVEAVLRHAPKNTTHILDLATGTGLVLEGLSNSFGKATLIGLDISERMMEECHQKLLGAKLQQCDIEAEQWPVEDNSMDVVSCAGALGLVSDMDHVLGETRRTLKQGGIAAMSFQIFNVKGGWGDGSGIKIYKRRSDEMEQLVRQAGFRVVEPVQEFTGFETSQTAELHGVISFTPMG